MLITIMKLYNFFCILQARIKTIAPVHTFNEAAVQVYAYLQVRISGVKCELAHENQADSFELLDVTSLNIYQT